MESHQIPGKDADYRIIVDAFRQATRNQRVQNKWIRDDDWVTIMQRSTAGNFFNTLAPQRMNQALARSQLLKDGLDDFANNPNGIVRRTYHSKRDERRVTCYYACEPGGSVRRPVEGIQWWENITHVDEILAQHHTRSSVAAVPQIAVAAITTITLALKTGNDYILILVQLEG